MAISRKVILLGHYGVGKTSLVKRAVYHKFSDKYLTTIGVNIEKKVVRVEQQEVSMIIWDIAGESSLAQIPATYQLGAHGIIYVVDLSRPDTWWEIEEKLSGLRKTLLNVPILLVGNKKDLLNENVLAEPVLSLSSPLSIMCSALTGENVEELFSQLARQML